MRILIIEDDTFFNKFYSLKLQEEGYDVVVAKDGVEGILKMKETLPDLVLLDIIMPKKDGFQVLTEKAQDPQLTTIPVLVFSTLGEQSDVQKALNLGAKDYINKSFFDFSHLKTKIKVLLNQPT